MMFRSSLIGPLGRQRGLHKPLKCGLHHSRHCNTRIRTSSCLCKSFSNLPTSINRRNYSKTKRTDPRRLHRYHHQNPAGPWAPSQCLPNVPRSKCVFAVGLWYTPDVRHNSRCYSSGSKLAAPPRKPTFKPTFVVQSARPNDRTNKEGGLRSEPSRRTESSKIDNIKESKLVGYRDKRRKDTQSISSLEREFSNEITRLRVKATAAIDSLKGELWERATSLKFDVMADIELLERERINETTRMRVTFTAARQSYTGEIEKLLAESMSRYPAWWVADMVSDIDLHLIAMENDLIRVENVVRERIQVLSDLLKEKLGIAEAETVTLTERKWDLEYASGFPQREAERNDWWAKTNRSDLNDIRTLSDIGANIGRVQDDFKAWFGEYILQLWEYRFEHGIRHDVREILYKISEVLQEIYETGEYIGHHAHFYRKFRRLRNNSRRDWRAFSYVSRYARSQMAVGEFLIGANVLRLRTMNHNQTFWAEEWHDPIPGGSNRSSWLRPTRLTDLGSIIRINTIEMSHLLDTFSFGVLSNERDSAIQERRAQAAALKPFQTASNGMMNLVNEIRNASDVLKLDDKVGPLRQCHNKLVVGQREIWDLTDVFIFANWRSNQYRISTRTRTLFFKPQHSQSNCLLSPITFNLLPGYSLRSIFNYNDYRGPQGKMIPIVYCLDIISMDSALAKLQHNGVVSVDVRWASGKMTGGDTPSDWFGRDVSVLTVSTQSQIVICHLARSRFALHKENIPNSLRQLLEDPTVIKVGLDIDGLHKRFMSYLNIFMQGSCDIAYLDRHVQFCSSTGAQPPASRDFKHLVRKYYQKSPIATSARQGDFWMDRLLLQDVQAVATEAYGCLRLFFTMSKTLLDLEFERLISIHGRSDQTTEKLGLLFPTTSTTDQNSFRDNSELSMVKEGLKDAPSSIQQQYEEFGPILIRSSRFGPEQLSKSMSLRLADRMIKARPELGSIESSLRFYCLWRILQCTCGDIETYLPQPQSSLPAIILEVIERFGLPYDLQIYEELQKMALLQFEAGQKLFSLEEQMKMSRLQDLSPAKLSGKVDALMDLIRGKIKAEKWINAMAKNDRDESAEERHTALLTFAMWYIAHLPLEKIARLLLQSKSRVAASILDGASYLHLEWKLSNEVLESLAQLTGNRPSWVSERLSKMTVKTESSRQESKGKKATNSKKLHGRSLTSPAVPSSRPARNDREMLEGVDLESSVQEDRHKVGGLIRRQKVGSTIRLVNTVGLASEETGTLAAPNAATKDQPGLPIIKKVESVTSTKSQPSSEPLSSKKMSTKTSSVQKNSQAPTTTSESISSPSTAQAEENESEEQPPSDLLRQQKKMKKQRKSYAEHKQRKEARRIQRKQKRIAEKASRPLPTLTIRKFLSSRDRTPAVAEKKQKKVKKDKKAAKAAAG